MSYDAPTKKRAASARERIERHLLDHPGVRYRLSELAFIGGCTEAGASARWREIARKWEGVKEETGPGVFAYWLTGKRAPFAPRPSKRDVEVAELRQRVERLERALSEGGGGR